MDVLCDPWKKHEYFLTRENEVRWKGTPGVGDILFGFNSVHMITHLGRKIRDIPQMTMHCHWDHGEDYFHHFEDPETIVERANYLHNFYFDKDAIKVVHHFDAYDKELWRVRHQGFRRQRSDTALLHGLPHWMYRPEVRAKPIENKVVFWRPLFNRENPYSWKMVFSNRDWERIIHVLECHGFEMTELTYRTPVREAFYHINTARFCIFYDGMWQYIVKNLCKPAIALGDVPGLLEAHDPQAVHFHRPDDKENDIWKYLDRMPSNLSHLDRRAKRYQDFIEKELCLK